MKIRYAFGIKLKITAAFSLVFICLSLFFNLYCYHQIRDLIIKNDNKYLLNQADRILSKIDVSPAIIPLPGNKTMIRVLSHSENRHHVLFESPGIIKRILTPAKNGVSDTLNMRVTYISSTNEDNPAEIVLVTDGTQLNKSLDYLLLLLVACSITSVILAGLVSYILAFYLLRPVQKIINAAKVISTNQLNDLIPVANTNDELQELTETINDMLARIAASLQQQQNFFASASHELKTPLAILRAELELGLKKSGINQGMSTLLNSQLTEINRLQLVVQEFLMISQLKSGMLSNYKEKVDIAELILKAFNQLDSLFTTKNIKPSIVFGKEIGSYTVTIDKDKLWIVLLNVIENAAKYSPQEATVSCDITESADKDYIKIGIINTTTHALTDTSLLKDAFYRADVMQQGSGIGLWLSSQLLAMQGGELLLSSENHTFKADLLLPAK